MLRNRTWPEFAFLLLTKRKAGSGDEIVSGQSMNVPICRNSVPGIAASSYEPGMSATINENQL